MKTFNIIISLAIAATTPLSLSAQTDTKNFSVKANAQIGLGEAMNLQSDIDGMTAKSSGNEFGVDFGWKFWQKSKHSLEANIGLGYNLLSAEMNLPKLSYNYSAPSNADMDGESYIRYSELKDLYQKNNIGRLTVPIYLSYGYQCLKWLDLHADLGIRLGFKSSSKVSEHSGQSFSYGIYPQYDNLMIDAPYMNDFGEKNLKDIGVDSPDAAGVSASLLAGLGAEFMLYGPLSLDLGIRYDAGMTNIFQNKNIPGNAFTAESAPLTYTVAEGTVARPLSDWFTSSKLSSLSLNLSLIYRF